MPSSVKLLALVGAAALAAAACQPHAQRSVEHGGPSPSAAPPPTSPPTQPEPVLPGGAELADPAPPIAAPPRTEGTGKENAIATCGARQSYEYVASEFRCADGSNPFRGDLRAAGDARRGNVGANSAGHVIDLYDVPCPEGNQEVYVDMYAGCGPGESPWNPA